ncbi:universal stress protein [Nonomuraea sp. NPDC047897]|uniref:universal stress protein n=1 Tax=Nonomuraea sp. NPDC047897 TaxID=3364346 RepID=UPI0037133B56
MTQPIVVGFDGSASSLQAVTWAGQEAEVRDAPLRVVHAAPGWSPAELLVPEPAAWETEAKAALRRQLEQAAVRARAGRPRLQVATEVGTGSPADVLLHAAEGAQLLVVGSRGRGGFAELVLGSVSHRVAGVAPCPVAVIREPQHGDFRTIVVGVSGRRGQDAVLEFAFHEAELRRSVLHAVHAWTHPGTVTPFVVEPVVYDVEAVGQDEALLLAQALAGWSDRFPDVELVQHVAHGHPAKALADASTRADLVVVGSRHGGPRTLALGGTAHAVLHHARTPVVVVRSG